MAVDSFRIQTGLPQLPEENIPRELYDNFFQLHRAIQNLVRGVSEYCGVDPVPEEFWDQVAFSQTLLSGNLTRMYLPASVAISRGQVVNLHSNAGVLNARLAVATSATTAAHGIANSSAAPGEVVEINAFRGLLDSVGGMITGTVYWLSIVPGAVQNTPPVAPGQIQQTIGVALTPSQLLMEIPLSWFQL